MRFETLYRRSLVFHWRMHVATALAVAVAAAVLTGALLVGDSMRGSLRSLALDRLGRIDHALLSARFFREQLAAELTEELPPARVCPAILLRGGIEHAESGRRVGRVNVLGIDERFWELGQGETQPAPAGRSVMLNEALARELEAGAGDDVLLRLERQDAIPTETLLGRRDDRTRSQRLTVQAVLAGGGLVDFTLTPTQREPYNVFVPLTTLQRAIGQQARANVLLVAGGSDGDALQHSLDERLTLADLGLKLRVDSAGGGAVLESDRLLIDPGVEAAAMAMIDAAGVARTPVLSYLANAIEVVQSPPVASDHGPAAISRSIPYSTIVAMDAAPAATGLTLADGEPAPVLGDDEILLNEWSAGDLQAHAGDTIRVTYYVTRDLGQLETESADLTLRGIVRMEGLAADRGLVPDYEGVTDAKRLSDWDPPFPIDLSRIREQDEAYWDAYGPTPKAFVSLATGESLWTKGHERFGRLTSIRIRPAAGRDLAASATAFERELLNRLPGEAMGLTFEPIRARALAAAHGSTDFAMLFIGFSLFLIISAALLVALLFRLGVERRAEEAGILLATGFTPRDVSRLLLAEGLCVAGAGTAVGLAGGFGYAWAMLAGLRSWWSAAVSAPFLRLHVTSGSLLLGLVASWLIGFVAVVWAMRGLSRSSPRSLLAGSASASPGPAGGKHRRPVLVGALALAAALALVLLSAIKDVIPQAPAFFASGAAMLVACLAALAAWLARPAAGTAVRPGPAALARLSIRNAARNPRRSLLTAGLIAAATFIIVAVGANRGSVPDAVRDRDSGTGGFTLLAESAIPVVHDLNRVDGREALNLPAAAADALADAVVMPFRLRSGDESSCLNLYQPRSPRILGAPDAMIQRGGFRFEDSLAGTDDERRNPWTLLKRELPGGAVPAIGDYNTVKWLLHLGLGRDLTITDQRGNRVSLRIVAMLSGSVLQGELIVAESRFVELFPSVAGYRFFLIDAAPAAGDALKPELENALADYGFDVTATADRLREYMAIENAYLSTFQMLGGLGLVLGAFGLGAVLLRNVWERRAELALLQALGYRRSALARLVLIENWALLLAGLAAGALSAGLAVAPHLLTRPAAVPWASLGATLLAVLAAGTLAGAVALSFTLRAPLMPALRRE